MVPAALLLLLLVVTQAAAVPATIAPARLHPSRPCRRTKQCSGVAADDAPKTENKGPAPERAHPLAILKNPHTYATEARQEPTASRTDFTPVQPYATWSAGSESGPGRRARPRGCLRLPAGSPAARGRNDPAGE